MAIPVSFYVHRLERRPALGKPNWLNGAGQAERPLRGHCCHSGERGQCHGEGNQKPISTELNFSLVCWYYSKHWMKTFTSQSRYKNSTVNLICCVEPTSSPSCWKSERTMVWAHLQVKIWHSSRPQRDCHPIEIISLLSFVFRTTLQSPEVEDRDISNPSETDWVFTLIFRNDFQQADNAVTQLQGILERAGT